MMEAPADSVLPIKGSLIPGARPVNTKAARDHRPDKRYWRLLPVSPLCSGA
uniref:Uncharacterized protein n=1 Tax=Ralstonia solanacearum TaxID=305 RepID=A0A0S4U8U5_RALSL|nr:protein of unknown function [Ralstonia solanacearum]